MNTLKTINRKLLILLGFSFALTACVTPHHGPHSAAQANKNSAASTVSVVGPALQIRTVSAWTAEDFANAKPFATPVVNSTVAQMKAAGLQMTPLSTEVISEEGQEGDGSLEGAHNLFSPSILPIAPLSALPAAVGSQGLHYSSSRLIPQSARTAYPYRTAGKMFFKDSSGGNWVCSAAVIKKRLIATAGHCVHSGSGGESGYYNSIVFVPAYQGNGDNQAPFGVWAASWVKTTQAWMTSGGNVPNPGDFAVFEVADQDFGGVTKTIGSRVGNLGYKTNTILPNQVKMLGYPSALDSGQIIHQVDSGNGTAAASSSVIYGSDLTQGASGGPWVQNFGRKAAGQPSAGQDQMNRLVGITSYVFTAAEPKVTGTSVLDATFRALVQEGCARAAGNCN